MFEDLGLKVLNVSAGKYKKYEGGGKNVSGGETYFAWEWAQRKHCSQEMLFHSKLCNDFHSWEILFSPFLKKRKRKIIQVVRVSCHQNEGV